MYFNRIELHNFGIYKGTHVMELQDRTGRRNITLIGGLNGRGKTTLHDAILIALYEKQALKYVQEKTRSFDKLLLEHMNKHATDDTTYLAVTLTLDDGAELRIKRSWKRNGAKADLKTVVEKNGEADKYLGQNWNYYVEEILPFGIARFFFFNNEKISQLADDVSFEQIKASIKSAIGVTAIEKSIAHLDEVIRRKEKAIKSFEHSELNQDYREVERRIAESDEEIAAATSAANAAGKRCDGLLAKLEATEKKFWATGGELGRDRDAIKEEMKKIGDEVESLQGKIQQMASDAATPLLLCRELVTRAYGAEKESQEERARRYSEAVISEIYRRLMDKIDAERFDEATARAVKGIIGEELREYLPTEEQPEQRSLSAAGMMLFEQLIATGFSAMLHRIQSHLARVQLQENEIMSLDAHLGNTDDKTLGMKLYEALKDIQAEKGAADAEHKKLLGQLSALSQRREALAKKRLSLLRAIAEKENTNDDDIRTVKYAAMSIEVQREFKARLQREKLTRLSQAVTDCFTMLVEKDSLVSKITIDPRELDITILDREGNPLLKSQLSAGEQQMFAISIVWALALTSGYKAPVLIDTPLARLDSAHRINFITKYLPAASSQVIVLSTDEEVYGRYHDLIRPNVIDYYTLLYHEGEQCTSIVPGYFEEVG